MNLQVAALAFELPSVEENRAATPLHILPSGTFSSHDGRPANLKDSKIQNWRLNRDDAAKVIALAQSKRIKMVVDYEHQTLNAAKNGKKAPAAGWVNPADLFFDDEIGLCAAKADWTDEGADDITKKKYRYLSPVFTFHPITGAVISLRHLALTNDPGLDCLNEVALRAALTLDQTIDNPTHKPPKEKPMENLMAVLKLSPQASESAAVEAVSSLQAQAASVTELQEQVVALKANQFDPAKHIPLEQHQAVSNELAALTAQAESNEHNQLMNDALGDARILPVNEPYWRKQPLAALKAFLTDAKPLVAALTHTQTNGKAPAAASDGGTVTLSEEELAVCKSLGVTVEAYVASRTA